MNQEEYKSNSSKLRKERWDSINHQLDEWYKGNPIHNNVTGECTPDFSCCRPELLADIELRMAYKNGNQSQRESLLFSFLGTAISSYKPEANVFIANGKDEITSIQN